MSSLSNLSFQEQINTLSDTLHSLTLIPVVALDRAQDAARLGEALVQGGLPCAEITFRTKAAADAIRIMARNYPDMLIGAGTVLNPAQAPGDGSGECPTM